MHQNRASPFASEFYRRRGYRREFRSEDHFYPFSSQKKSRFASDFLRRGNRASWGFKKSRGFSVSGNNRRLNRRKSRDFGALSSQGSPQRAPARKPCLFLNAKSLVAQLLDPLPLWRYMALLHLIALDFFRCRMVSGYTPSKFALSQLKGGRGREHRH